MGMPSDRHCLAAGNGPLLGCAQPKAGDSAVIRLWKRFLFWRALWKVKRFSDEVDKLIALAKKNQKPHGEG